MQPKKEEESPIEPKEALSTTGGPPEKGATSPSAPALLSKPAASSNNVERGQPDKSEPQSTHRDVVSEKEQEETRKEEEEEEHEAGEKKGAPTVTTATFSSRGEPKGPPQACLFVASLSSQATEEVLHQHFSQYGEVLKIKIMRDPASRPYAFVQFKRVEDANAALLSSNDQVLQGRRLRVEKAKVNRTLFIAKMSRSLTAQKLREIVEPFGPIESVTIIKNHHTQKSKGCGFVKFEFREDAMEAFLSMKQTHRRWVIEWATSTNESELMTGVDKHNIFVGGLNPTQITKELLQERFEGYGPIESISLVKKDEGEEPET
ncbi:Meiotic activator RIM4, partial [Balamuthia mandrillaris]